MAIERNPQPVFRRVLACFESNSQFAAALGVSPQHVDYWLKLGYIPSRWAMKSSTATMGKVTILELAREAERNEDRRAAERQARKAAKRVAGQVDLDLGGANGG